MHIHFIYYSNHVQTAFHMPGCGLRRKYFSYPRISPEGADLEELGNLPKVLEQKSSDQGFKPDNLAPVPTPLTARPQCLPGSPIHQWTGQILGQNWTGQPTSHPNKTGPGLPSQRWESPVKTLCLAKEQMFNNFAVARRRLHNMAELFLNFGKCWLLFSECLL